MLFSVCVLTTSGVAVFMRASSFNADISSWAVDQGSDFYESELATRSLRTRCAESILKGWLTTN